MIMKNSKNIEIYQGCQNCELTSTNVRIKNLKRTKKLTIALVGQPNSGKSTFFNSLSNYKVNTANYPGTTVGFNSTTIYVKDYQVEILDLPGLYSLNYSDLAEKITFEILTNSDKSFKIDGIIQVIETASLPHSLLLTMDLITLDIPIVIALNMFDEARIKGINVNIPKLQEIFNLPVIPTISIKGENTFLTVLKLIELIEKTRKNHSIDSRSKLSESNKDQQNYKLPDMTNQKLTYYNDEKINNLLYKIHFSENELPYIVKNYKEIWKKLMKDIFQSTDCHIENCKVIPACLMNIEKIAPNMISLANIRDELLKLKSNIITSISSFVFSLGEPKPTFDDLVDKYVLSKKSGYFILFGIFFIAFYLAYFTGNFTADKMEIIFGFFDNYISNFSENLGILKPLIDGIKDGIFGGIGIVIPYLIPFIFFMSLLEDSGYIPRMMYLVNDFLKPFGITARSVLGFVLGLGCNVSAIMSLRGAMNNNERILAGMVIPFITCSARTVVLMALVVGYLGALWGIFMYILAFTVAFTMLLIINKFLKFSMQSFMIHIPSYRFPSLKNILSKVWLRFKSFVYSAWPVLILGTITINYISYFQIDGYINSFLSFFTTKLLGLPDETGIPLIFGILAKEYALVMLFSAFGTQDIKSVMTNLQIFTFCVFMLLYTPCLSTIAVQTREIGLKYTIYSIILSFLSATLISFMLNKLIQIWKIL